MTLPLATLEDDEIRLVPLTQDHLPGIAVLVDDDDVRAYTRIPTEPPATWLANYEDGWREGSRAGFAIETHEGEFLGLGLFVRIEPEGRQGEIGYVVGPAARGRGVATRTLERDLVEASGQIVMTIFPRAWPSPR